MIPSELQGKWSDRIVTHESTQFGGVKRELILERDGEPFLRSEVGADYSPTHAAVHALVGLLNGDARVAAALRSPELDAEVAACLREWLEWSHGVQELAPAGLYRRSEAALRSRPPVKQEPLSIDAGNDTPWPVRECLSRLAWAADHLLGAAHNCDCHGHEVTRHAVNAALRLLAEEPVKQEPADVVERVRLLITAASRVPGVCRVCSGKVVADIKFHHDGRIGGQPSNGYVGGWHCEGCFIMYQSCPTGEK